MTTKKKMITLTNEADAVKLLVNGRLVDYQEMSDYLQHLVLLLNVRGVMVNGEFQTLTPFDVLKENMVKIFETFIELCDFKRKEQSGAERARTTKLMNATRDRLDSWQSIKALPEFLQRYYDFVLGLQDLGTLPGFGGIARVGDKKHELYGNPERTPIDKLWEKA